MRRRFAATIVLVGALAVRLGVAWAPARWLLARVLGDDPFYYFTIARHLARGLGPSFDGAAATNGFHPLWLVLLTPIFALVPGPWSAIHAALTLAALLDVAALALLIRLLRGLEVAEPVTIAVAGLYAASPIVLSPAGPMSGLETAAGSALAFAFLVGYEGAWSGRAVRAWRLGTIAGLWFLARTDNAIVLAFAFAALLWRRRGDARARRRLLAAMVVAAGVAAPWVAWCWARFGSPVQVSGLSIALFNRAAAAANDWTAIDWMVKAAHNLATVAAYFPVFHRNLGSFAGAAAANLALAIAVVVGAVQASRRAPAPARAELRERAMPWVPLLIAGAAFVVVHTLRAVELRAWYFSALLPIAYLCWPSR